MNPKPENQSRHNNDQPGMPNWDELERLVDGRLSHDEYRELLCRIEEHPDGWRKCALAFLEEQALRKELSDDLFSLEQPATDEPHESANVADKHSTDKIKPDAQPDRMQATSEFFGGSSATKNQPGLEQSWSEKVKLWMTIAACFVGAFFIGVLASINWSDANVADVSPIKYLDTNPAPIETLMSTDSRPAGNVTMSLNDPGQARQVLNVPIYDGEKQADEYVDMVEQGMPLELNKMLKDSNLHVEKKQYVVPVDGESGKWLLVPIEQLRIAPADNWKYQ